MLRGAAAQSAGMVDGVKSYDAVIAHMKRNAKPARNALRAAQNELEILG